MACACSPSRVDGSHAGTMEVAMPSFVVMRTLMVAAMMVPSITPVDSIVSEVTLEDIPRVTRAMLGGHTRGRILVRPSEQ